MYNDIVILLKENKSVNAYGDIVKTTTQKMIFAEVKSIGAKEFYQAQMAGMKPEIKFVIADYLDYQGEQTLKYKPYAGEEQEYSIIRTYRNGNSLEITASRGVDKNASS